MPFSKLCRLYAALVLCALLFSAGGLFMLMRRPAAEASPLDRYYRAVYILQSFGGPAAAEEECIPRGIARADETENLLHHSDRIFVLRHVADELAALQTEKPRAVFYEACARLALGERDSAVNLLTRYVIEQDYASSHYSLLSGILYELGDYRSLLLICREWQERDPSCREDRIRLAWTALYNLGRYPQARRYMREEGACLGWRADVYDAKTALAMGYKQEAVQTLETSAQRFSGNATQIWRLWNLLKDKNRV